MLGGGGVRVKGLGYRVWGALRQEERSWHPHVLLTAVLGPWLAESSVRTKQQSKRPPYQTRL